MHSTRDINRAFTDDGNVIDVTPTTTGGEIVRRMGHDPNTTDLVQRTSSGLPKIVRSDDRFDPSNGQNVDIQMRGIEGKKDEK